MSDSAILLEPGPDLEQSGLAQPVVCDITLGLDPQITVANLAHMGMRRADAQQLTTSLYNLFMQQTEAQRADKRQQLGYRLVAIQGAAAGGLDEAQLVQNEMQTSGLTRMQAEGFVRYALAAERAKNDPQPLQPAPSDVLAGLPRLAAEFLTQGYPPDSTAEVFTKQWLCTKQQAMALVHAGMTLKEGKPFPPHEPQAEPPSQAPLPKIVGPQGFLDAPPEDGRRKLTPALRWALSLTLMALSVYIVMGNILAQRVEGTYFNLHNCPAVIQSYGWLSRAYIWPFTNQVRPLRDECLTYVSAEAYFARQDWQHAYEQYRLYIDTYPDGILLQELRPRAARSQLEWGRSQAEAAEYEASTQNLAGLVGEFSDQPEALEALKLLPQVYMDWGTSLLEAGSFDLAIEKFTLAAERYESPVAGPALAQAYVDWGRALAQDGSFEEAQGKFELALTAGALGMDEILADFYEAWTGSLAAGGQYAQALDLYRDPKNLLTEAGREQGITRFYIKWAFDLKDREDFNAALEKLSAARGSPGAERLPAQIDAADHSILQAFSASSGTQASALIDSASQSLCQQVRLPEGVPPILGIDPEQVLIRIFPLGAVLGAEPGLLATSPGAFHYVVCVDPKSTILQTCPYIGGYSLVRKQLAWAVRMYSTLDGTLVAKTEIPGGVPEYCGPVHYFVKGNYVDTLTGSLPPYGDLKAWILKRLE